jgi:hypothetical protein
MNEIFDDTRMSSGLHGRGVWGGMVTVASQGGMAVSRLLATVVLARILALFRLRECGVAKVTSLETATINTQRTISTKKVSDEHQ